MDPEKNTGLTYGSSIVYIPETNTLKELDSIIVKGIFQEKLIGTLEHTELNQRQFIEKGFYDVNQNKFIVKNK